MNDSEDGIEILGDTVVPAEQLREFMGRSIHFEVDVHEHDAGCEYLCTQSVSVAGVLDGFYYNDALEEVSVVVRGHGEVILDADQLVDVSWAPYLIGKPNSTTLERIVEFSETSETFVTYEILAAPTLPVAQAWAEQHRPPRHCTHAFDCCGRYYPRVPDVRDLGFHRFAIVQSWYQNV